MPSGSCMRTQATPSSDGQFCLMIVDSRPVVPARQPVDQLCGRLCRLTERAGNPQPHIGGRIQAHASRLLRVVSSMRSPSSRVCSRRAAVTAESCCLVLFGGDGGGGEERRGGEAAPEGGRAVGGESGDGRRGDGEAEARGELEAARARPRTWVGARAVTSAV